ncbi:hypothetical protein [Haladaptatus sp. CMAA 1911]|uniref:hypothetical protein n=1 Tax=unclassified Haladaptatus TaxID=2622732 RepID=UPI0037552FF4
MTAPHTGGWSEPHDHPPSGTPFLPAWEDASRRALTVLPARPFGRTVGSKRVFTPAFGMRDEDARAGAARASEHRGGQGPSGRTGVRFRPSVRSGGAVVVPSSRGHGGRVRSNTKQPRTPQNAVRRR